jgi:predicted nicotinamide N-methyase
MEGLCDMFVEETSAQDYKKKVVEIKLDNGKSITIYEKDHKEDGVLIGEAVWHGAKIMANWIVKNCNLFEGKKVLEIGSGPGLSGFACALAGAQQVVFSDYKEPVMELIAQNIEAFKQ